MTKPTTQPDVRVTIRRPAEPDDVADRRLRAALKALLRRYGLRAVTLAYSKHEGSNHDGSR